MNPRSYKDLLDAAARSHFPDDTNFMPRIAARLERKTFMQSLRARPVMAALIALLVLLMLSGVAYAVGKSLGYIPGYGIVDLNAQMRMLAEPVSQTREDITIAIEEMYLTSDKLYLTTATKGIPNNLMLPMSDTTTVTCKGNWIYQLPDGSQLNFEIGSGHGTMDPLESNDLNLFSFHARGYARLSTPINVAEITDIILRIPCVVSDIPAGSLPENWEFHLRFVPVPASMTEMTAFPVTEYPPSYIPTNAPKSP